MPRVRLLHAVTSTARKRLVVHAVLLPSGDKTSDLAHHTQQPLAGVGVMLKWEGNLPTDGVSAQITNNSGTAVFTHPQTSDLSLTITDAPSGTDNKTWRTKSNVDPQPKPTEIDKQTKIGPKTTEVWIGVEAAAATISGRVLAIDGDGSPAYGRHNGVGEHAAGSPIGGVTVELRQNGMVVDTTTSKGDGDATLGTFVFTGRASGVYQIGGEPTVTVREGKDDPTQMLSLIEPTPVTVSVRAGESLSGVELRYAAQPAQVEVSGMVVQTVDLTGEEQRRPVPISVEVLSAAASPSSPPLRRITTLEESSAVISGLMPGSYRLRVSPSIVVDGRVFEVFNPPNGEMIVAVGPGSTANPTLFLYHELTGQVTAMVVNATRNEGVSGAPLTLRRLDRASFEQKALTNDNGVAAWHDVAAGNYVVGLSSEKFLGSDGRRYAPAVAGVASTPVSVRAGSTATAEPILVEVDIPYVFGVIRGMDGGPLRHQSLTITSADGHRIYRTVTNERGEYRQEVAASGRWRVRLDGPLNHREFVVDVRSPGRLDINLADLGSAPELGGGGFVPVPQPLPTPELTSAVGELSAYPVLTEEIGGGAAPSSLTGGGSGAAPLGQLVERELRAVLGWRTRDHDPKGFLGALAQSFKSEVNDQGQTRWTWVPRSYAVTVDAGAITGAQASIYTRAKAALDQSIPLLDGLYGLDAAADPQNVEAIREVVRSQFHELVYELGKQEGPSVQRVDSLFTLLTGISPSVTTANQAQILAILATTSNEEIGGTLGQLRDIFGLLRDSVNTVAEEEDLTNYLIIVDYIVSLEQSWVSQRAFFDISGLGGAAQPFFGTRMVLLNRQLGVVAESVQEVEFAMDSVFLRAGERAAIRLRSSDSTPDIFVGELLNWAKRFAAEEGPRLVEEGGKIGVARFFPTVDILTLRLRDARAEVQLALGVSLPAGYRTARVQRALSELGDQMAETARLARPFAAQQEDLSRSFAPPSAAAPAGRKGAPWVYYRPAPTIPRVALSDNGGGEQQPRTAPLTSE